MDQTLEQAINRLHDSPAQCMIAATGGGSQAVAWLLAVPGASRTLLSAVIPYSANSLVRFLGATPEQFCSAGTARAMAMSCFWEARQLGDDAASGSPRVILGIGCTASLVSDRPKQGEHRAHIAVQSEQATQSCSLTLHKGRRSRQDEEQLLSYLLIDRLLETAGIMPRPQPSLTAADRLEVQTTQAQPDWQALLSGALRACCTDGRQITSETPPDPARIILSGAFHPLHEGHLQMAEVARNVSGLKVEFEISVKNVDKPPLDFYEINFRLKQFGSDQPVWLSRAATFVEKARLYPGATFAVGVDTLQRIAEPRYYGQNPDACIAAVREIASRGCRFLVFGRASDGQFLTGGDLPLPEPLRAICQNVPADQFRVDLSSTQLRRRSN